MKSLLVIVFCLTLLDLSLTAIGSTNTQSVSNSDKNEYRAAIPRSDKHKFGYELGENRHFHHTSTDEDGVRLGCYGHVLEGKKYSTQYVADMKGYRTVPTQDLISVFPKSGGERKASFTRQFAEDDAMSQNIRFFFPDACGSREEIIAEPSIDRPVYVAPPPTTPPTTRAPTTEAPQVCPKPNCVCTCT